MKQDVLEQIVEDYLKHKGFFTQHNVKFRPDEKSPDYDPQKHSVRSDIDVLGINPKRRGKDKVWAVTCKSWQAGFSPETKLRELEDRTGPKKRPTWKGFRELGQDNWNEAFRDKVHDLTGEKSFTYKIAVTRINKGLTPEEAADIWNGSQQIKKSMKGCEFGFLTLEQMWRELVDNKSRTPEASEMGRLTQLLRAAGLLDMPDLGE